MEKQVKQKKSLFHTSKETNYKKLYMYVIVVNYGYSDPVVEWLRHYGSNVQYVCLGSGTASSDAKRIIGLENNDKEIITAFVSEENLIPIRDMMSKMFDIHKKIMGFGFTIQLSSLVGEKMYHFLSNFIEGE